MSGARGRGGGLSPGSRVTGSTGLTRADGTFDYAFAVDRGAVNTGVMAVARSFDKLIVDVATKGKK